MIIIAELIVLILIGIIALLCEITNTLKKDIQKFKYVFNFCWVLYALLLCAFGFFFYGLPLLILNEIKAKNLEKYLSNNYLFYADNIISLLLISYPLIRFIQILNVKIISYG